MSKKVLTVLLALICTVTMCFGTAISAFAEESVATDYGTITAEYADAQNYPFAKFNADGFIGAYRYWASSRTEIGGQAATVMGSVGNADSVTILLRRDYTLSTESWYDGAWGNWGWKKGPVVIDLGGHNLSFTNNGTNQPFIGYETKGNTTNITVKNGTLTFGTDPLIKATRGTNNLSVLNVEFENVNLVYDKSSDTGAEFITYPDSWGAGNGVDINVTFNSCNIDVTNYALATPLFNAGSADSSARTSYKFIGGSINAGADCSFAWTKINNEKSSVNFEADSNDSKTVLYVPTSSLLTNKEVNSGSSIIYWTKDISLATETSDCYVLTSTGSLPGEVVTDYGTIPVAYSESADYPFVMFSQTESFLGGYKTWGHNTSSSWGTTESESLMGNWTNGATVLLRRDFNLGATTRDGSWSNLGWKGGTMTIDLGGNTLVINGNTTKKTMFSYETKGGTTGVVVKDGKIVYGDAKLESVVRGTNNASTLNLSFENVEFVCRPSSDSAKELVAYPASWGTGNGITLNINYTDCEFDITNSKSQKALFDAGSADGLAKANFTVCGGNITASSAITNTWANISNESSSVTFSDNADSNKITLTVPENTKVLPEPIDASGNRYVFVKSGSNDGFDVYALTIPSDYAICLKDDSVMYYNIKGDCTLIIVGYAQSGELIDVKTFALTKDNENTVDITNLFEEAPKKVKAFIWSDMNENITPLCVAQEVEY